MTRSLDACRVKLADGAVGAAAESEVVAAQEPSDEVNAEAAVSRGCQSGSADVAAGPGKRKCGDDGGTSELLRRQILRLNECGMRTAQIAKVLETTEDEVLSALVKRRCCKAGHLDEKNAHSSPDSPKVEDGSESRTLMRRLLEDPVKLSCPIWHSLMADPVVAEDGHTYEREAVASALVHRANSPTTGAVMGMQLVSNLAVKADIVDYKDQTVEEIIVVVPRLASGEAVKLLKRAEAFVRPKLPDAAARRRLVELLKLRARLPLVLRDGAVKELLMLVIDTADLGEVLQDFEALSVAYHLSELEDESIKALIVAESEGLHRAPVSVCLGHEHARRLAKTLSANPGAAQSLWQLVQQLGELHPSDWTGGAAAVLAGLWTKLSLDLTSVKVEVLRQTARFLEDAVAHDAKVLGTFGDLFPAATSTTRRTALAEVLLALSEKEAEVDQVRDLLLQGRRADVQNQQIRRRLIQLITEDFESGRSVDEVMLLGLLFEEEVPVPSEMRTSLHLKAETLNQLPPQALLSLAEQLVSVDRGADGSRAAVEAAHLHEAAGNKAAAGQAYLLAYSMDRSNEEASHGAVESLRNLTEQLRSQIANLCEDNEHLKSQNTKLQKQYASLVQLCIEIQRLAEQGVTLTETNRELAQAILRSFLDPQLAGPDHRLTTNQVWKRPAANVPWEQLPAFKSLLLHMCTLAKSGSPEVDGVWTLRPELRTLRPELRPRSVAHASG